MKEFILLLSSFLSLVCLSVTEVSKLGFFFNLCKYLRFVKRMIIKFHIDNTLS